MKITDKVEAKLIRKIREDIADLVFNANLDEKTIIGIIRPDIADFDKELVDITYNYIKYLIYLKAKGKTEEGAFEKFLNKLEQIQTTTDLLTEGKQEQALSKEDLETRNKEREKIAEIYEVLHEAAQKGQDADLAKTDEELESVDQQELDDLDTELDLEKTYQDYLQDKPELNDDFENLGEEDQNDASSSDLIVQENSTLRAKIKLLNEEVIFLQHTIAQLREQIAQMGDIDLTSHVEIVVDDDSLLAPITDPDEIQRKINEVNHPEENHDYNEDYFKNDNSNQNETSSTYSSQDDQLNSDEQTTSTSQNNDGSELSDTDQNSNEDINFEENEQLITDQSDKEADQEIQQQAQEEISSDNDYDVHNESANQTSQEIDPDSAGAVSEYVQEVAVELTNEVDENAADLQGDEQPRLDNSNSGFLVKSDEDENESQETQNKSVAENEVDDGQLALDSETNLTSTNDEAADLTMLDQTNNDANQQVGTEGSSENESADSISTTNAENQSESTLDENLSDEQDNQPSQNTSQAEEQLDQETSNDNNNSEDTNKTDGTTTGSEINEQVDNNQNDSAINDDNLMSEQDQQTDSTDPESNQNITSNSDNSDQNSPDQIEDNNSNDQQTETSSAQTDAADELSTNSEIDDQKSEGFDNQATPTTDSESKALSDDQHIGNESLDEDETIDATSSTNDENQSESTLEENSSDEQDNQATQNSSDQGETNENSLISEQDQQTDLTETETKQDESVKDNHDDLNNSDEQSNQKIKDEIQKSDRVFIKEFNKYLDELTVEEWEQAVNSTCGLDGTNSSQVKQPTNSTQNGSNLNGQNTGQVEEQVDQEASSDNNNLEDSNQTSETTTDSEKNDNQNLDESKNNQVEKQSTEKTIWNEEREPEVQSASISQDEQSQTTLDSSTSENGASTEDDTFGQNDGSDLEATNAELELTKSNDNANEDSSQNQEGNDKKTEATNADDQQSEIASTDENANQEQSSDGNSQQDDSNEYETDEEARNNVESMMQSEDLTALTSSGIGINGVDVDEDEFQTDNDELETDENYDFVDDLVENAQDEAEAEQKENEEKQLFAQGKNPDEEVEDETRPAIDGQTIDETLADEAANSGQEDYAVPLESNDQQSLEENNSESMDEKAEVEPITNKDDSINTDNLDQSTADLAQQTEPENGTLSESPVNEEDDADNSNQEPSAEDKPIDDNSQQDGLTDEVNEESTVNDSETKPEETKNEDDTFLEDLTKDLKTQPTSETPDNNDEIMDPTIDLADFVPDEATQGDNDEQVRQATIELEEAGFEIFNEDDILSAVEAATKEDNAEDGTTKFAGLEVNEVELGEEVIYQDKHYYIMGAEKVDDEIILQLEPVDGDEIIKAYGKDVKEIDNK